MRKTYRFSSCVCQGEWLYSHKIANDETISNKEELRIFLSEMTKKFELIDTTVKIYDQIFFFFFMMKPKTVPIELINAIQDGIVRFGNWDDKYVYTTIYDLKEYYLRKDLENGNLIMIKAKCKKQEVRRLD